MGLEWHERNSDFVTCFQWKHFEESELKLEIVRSEQWVLFHVIEFFA